MFFENYGLDICINEKCGGLMKMILTEKDIPKCGIPEIGEE